MLFDSGKSLFQSPEIIVKKFHSAQCTLCGGEGIG